MPTFPASVWRSLAHQMFLAAGVPEAEAAQVADSLVLANLSGHDSHGLIRIMQYVAAIQDGRLKPGAPLQILRQTPALLQADGGWGMGQVQAHRLLEQLIERAKTLGLAAGTLKHCGHVGRLGEYAEAAAARRMAFLGSVNNHGFGRGMAPPGGTEARIGTNPLCLGVPTKEEPVVLDIGTSVCAEGKIRVSFNKGQPVPFGFLLDEHGQPTTDPGVLYREPRGSILPLGGTQAYKGFGIGLLLDMFVGGFSGAPCSYPTAPNLSSNAAFFLVLDIAAFAGEDHFLNQVSTLANNVRTCPRAEGVTEIMLPGDPERLARQTRSRDGITLDDGTWKQLVELAGKLKVAVP